MEEFLIFVTYGLKPYTLKCVKEYESAQIMRIRVYGKNDSIVLQNNYPILKFSNSKKRIDWKLVEGSFITYDKKKNAELLENIMTKLEEYIKGKNPNALIEYLRAKNNLYNLTKKNRDHCVPILNSEYLPKPASDQYLA